MAEDGIELARMLERQLPNGLAKGDRIILGYAEIGTAIGYAEISTAIGYAERAWAKSMPGRSPRTRRRRTVAADKDHDARGVVADVPARSRPHVLQTHYEPKIGDRRPHHQVSGPSLESADPVQDRGAVRVDRDHRRRRKLRCIGRWRNCSWLEVSRHLHVIRIAALDAEELGCAGSGCAGSGSDRSNRPRGAHHRSQDRTISDKTRTAGSNHSEPHQPDKRSDLTSTLRRSTQPA